MADDKKYLLKNRAKGWTAGRIVYWKAGRDGYTTALHEAGVYPHAEASAILKTVSREHAEPIELTPELLSDMLTSLDEYEKALDEKFQAVKTAYEKAVSDCKKKRSALQALR